MEQSSKLSDYPRVLIVGGSPLQRTSAQGITLANLFSGWDKEALAQIYLADTEPDSELCNKGLRLDETIFPVDFYLRKLMGKAIRVDHPLTRKSGGIGVAAGAKLNLRVRLHLAARSASDVCPCVLPKSAANWIRDFRPDVIYSCLGNVRLIRLAMAASEAAEDVPIVPHFMDDWPATLYADGRLWNIPRDLHRRSLRKLLKRAPLGFSIGKSMSEEYQLRYGLDFHDFMNCVDDEEFEESPYAGGPTQGPLVWTHVGGLHAERWMPLAVVAQTIAAQGAILQIFGPARDIAEHRSHFSGLPNVRIGTLPSGDILKTMKQSDVLIHVESFEEAEAAYMRFSVSTKLSQYLSSGRTVFGYGPPGMASLKLIEDAGAGIAVTKEDPAELASAVRKIATDSGFRRDCASHSLLYATEHLKKSVVQNRFRKALKLAAVAKNATVLNA